MMIYTVECSFADPHSEAEWNAFYSLDKLPALISVSGFHTSQRFKALSAGCPVYLALHSIDGLDILTGEEYSQKGGGNFARWQQHITDWHRNLYEGVERAPAVGETEYLVLSTTGPQPLRELGLTPVAMRAVAMATKLVSTCAAESLKKASMAAARSSDWASLSDRPTCFVARSASSRACAARMAQKIRVE